MMASSISCADWKKILILNPVEQKKFLRWHLQAREPIHRLSDLKPGDHLLMTRCRGKLSEYEHHFYCNGKDKISGKPKIIHYYNTKRNAIKQKFPTSLGSGSCLEQLGAIKEVTLPDGDLIKERNVDPKTTKLLNGVEVERVVWPEQLRRYSTEQEIRRASDRLGESYYHLTKNNCESFVMWCLCDLNISLQVTRKKKVLCEAGSAAIRTFWQGFQQLPKVGVEIWDDVAAAGVRSGLRNALLKAGVCFGAISTVVVETIMAIVDIHTEYKKWRSGISPLVKTRKDFIAEVVDRVIMAICRAGGSIAGMIVGQIVIPVPVVGGLVGALVGIFGGHLFGKVVLAKSNVKEALAQCIDALIDNFDEVKAKLKAHAHKFE